MSILGILKGLASEVGLKGLTVEYNEKTDKFICYMNIGRLIGFLDRKSMFSGKKSKALFSSVNAMSFSFDSFFIEEVLAFFEETLRVERWLPVNKELVKELVDFLKAFQNKSSETKQVINLKRIKETMKFQVLQHQLPVMDKYNEIKNKFQYRGLLINAAVGSGKTAMAAFISEALEVEVVVVIAPLRIITTTWVSAVSTEMYIQPPTVYMVGKGKYNNEKYILCNYEQLDKLFDLVGILKNKKTSIVVDESHNFAEATSLRTKRLIELVNIIDTNDVLLLSGTPVKAYRKEFITIFRLLDKRFNDKIEEKFKVIYNSPSNIHADTLAKRFGDYSIKVEKTELALPELSTENLYVDIKNKYDYTLENIKLVIKDFIEKRKIEIEEILPEARERYYNIYNKYKKLTINKNIKADEFNNYENLIKTIIKHYQARRLFEINHLLPIAKTFENNLMNYMDVDEKRMFKESSILVKYPMLKIQGEVLSGVIGKYRINCHRDMASAIEYKDIINGSLKKTIIFSSYVDVCNACYEKVKKEGFKPVMVYGEYLKSANSNIDAFKKDEKINPLIATYKSLSTGVRLTEANTIITLDLPFRLYLYEQAVGRAHRLGQDNNVTVHIPTLYFSDPTANINSRNIDIISFFRTEVENITGIKADIDLDLGNEGFFIGNEEFQLDINILNNTYKLDKTITQQLKYLNF